MRKPEPGRYIAFLWRIDGPAEDSSILGAEGRKLRRLRSDYLLDAIALDAVQAGIVTDVEPAKRPLFRLKTTEGHFNDQINRIARSGDWFLLDVKSRHGGSWVWAGIEDPDSPTGYEYAGDFSADAIAYLDPDAQVGPARSGEIAKAFSIVRQTSLLGKSPQTRKFRWLNRALSKAPKLWVEAIDVGQASFICIHNGLDSLMYFDVGLPLWFNAKSIPGSFNYYPPHKHAIIVLSHWDYDHYSALYKKANLAALPCIAPAGELGPNASKLAKKMGRRLWALNYGVTKTIGPVKLRWATGQVGDRNNRGIVGIVEFDGQKILLTGDASYRHIKQRYRNGLTGVSVPHHASLHSHLAADVPVSNQPASAVISAGVANKYGHPSGIAIDDHRVKNWDVKITGSYPLNSRGNKLLSS